MDKKWSRGLKIGGLAALVLGVGVVSPSCVGSCSNACNDLSRDMSKRNYHLDLYDTNGKKIMDKDINNTYINVTENGSGIRFVENGKLVMVNGTYVLTEK